MKRDYDIGDIITIARRRKLLLSFLVGAPTALAAWLMAIIVSSRGTTYLEWVVVFFFASLFAWICLGFWIGMFGFALLIRRHDKFSINNTVVAPLAPDIRVAVLMPICNENTRRVFAGLRAVIRSVLDTGSAEHFDFFILSDSPSPDIRVEEEIAWQNLCAQTAGFGKIFYRQRRNRLKRKSGNIADFCRRWGTCYQYMVVLDADSIVSGQTLLRLAQLMEANPKAGIIQTVPRAIRAETLYARMQQFAMNTYGKYFSAGLHYFQLGQAELWGHNAIIRVAPFIRHCGLSRLSGKPPLGGDILSHDFVESALMCRAGWTVWIAYDLTGSYEEIPPTLDDALKRDRRWCQGNLQHTRLLATEGIANTHRVLFLHGTMSYLSALLWLLFLTLSTVAAIMNAIIPHNYFPHPDSLFPAWPVNYPQFSIALLIMTLTILLLPKLLFIIGELRTRNRLGDGLLLFPGVMLETMLTTIMAPARMLAHVKFILLTLFGGSVDWTSQRRNSSSTGRSAGGKHHWIYSLAGFLCAGAAYLLDRHYYYWSAPIWLGLILTPFIVAYTADTRRGRWLRDNGIFRVPEETPAAPPELAQLESSLREEHRNNNSREHRGGFSRAVIDPLITELHVRLLRGSRRLHPAIARRRDAIVEKALRHGPDQLTIQEKQELLYDAQRLLALHCKVWTLPADKLFTDWGVDITSVACHQDRETSKRQP